MNRDDVIDFLSVVHASDHRTTGEADVTFWMTAFEMCGHTISKPDAIAAVVKHALDPTAPYLKPGHVVAGAREIAHDRMMRETLEQRQARTDAIDAVIDAKSLARTTAAVTRFTGQFGRIA